MATAVELLPKRTRTCAEGLVRKGSPLATGLLLILVDLVAARAEQMADFDVVCLMADRQDRVQSPDLLTWTNP